MSILDTMPIDALADALERLRNTKAIVGSRVRESKRTFSDKECKCLECGHTFVTKRSRDICNVCYTAKRRQYFAAKHRERKAAGLK